MDRFASQRRAWCTQDSFSPFGKKLIQLGYANNEQMHQALVESRKTGRPLTDVLTAITGRQLSPDLQQQYKQQQLFELKILHGREFYNFSPFGKKLKQLFELKILHGIESYNSEDGELSTAQVGQLINDLIPLGVCRRYRLVPLSLNAEPLSLLVAMVHPDNLDAQDDLNHTLRPKGIALKRLVITLQDYQSLIGQYLYEQERQKQLELQSKVNVQSSYRDGLGYMDSKKVPEDVENNLDIAGTEANPVVALVNKILIKALQERASDIHVEPQEKNLRIRFRCDGVLREAFPESFPKKIISAVTARFKIIAQLDITKRNLPQEGRIQRVFDGKKVNFRVSILPSHYGEKVVLRIFNNEIPQLGLHKLIENPESLRMMQNLMRRPFGLILVAGPTGSGRKTTLYSALAERNEPGVNIMTIEDSIGYMLPGLTQVQVNREKGFNFSTILRSCLTQDPDVILVSELRELETAKAAIEAALTGHLVLTTLRTNDAASAIARLYEMGVEPSIISGALVGVVAQKLVRRLCADCRIPYTPDQDELDRFGLSTSHDGELTLYRANVLCPQEILEAQSRGQLCQRCSGLGYRGRCGVYEIMQVSEEIQSLINQRAPTKAIQAVAIEEGMQTLLSYSLSLVQQGLTTLEEVERTTFSNTELEAELKSKRKAAADETSVEVTELMAEHQASRAAWEDELKVLKAQLDDRANQLIQTAADLDHYRKQTQQKQEERE